jgi:hypothetical protein
MTSQEDLLARTGQVWKLFLLPAGFLIGTLLIICAWWVKGDVSDAIFRSYIFGGMAVDVVAVIVPFVTINCPRCHALWLWRLCRREQIQDWYRIMRSQVRCPKCGYFG